MENRGAGPAARCATTTAEETAERTVVAGRGCSANPRHIDANIAAIIWAALGWNQGAVEEVAFPGQFVIIL